MTQAHVTLTGTPPRSIVISDPRYLQTRDDRTGRVVERTGPSRITEVRTPGRTVYAPRVALRTVYVTARGPQGGQGEPGPGTKRYTTALSGLTVVIPPAQHALGLPRFAAVQAPSGGAVSVAYQISPDGTVTVESLIPLDGYTLTLE